MHIHCGSSSGISKPSSSIGPCRSLNSRKEQLTSSVGDLFTHTEILDLIFKYMLWIPESHLSPSVVITNAVSPSRHGYTSSINSTIYREPTYTAEHLELADAERSDDFYDDDFTSKRCPLSSRMIKGKTIYHEGREVIQLNRIRRLAIDATCHQTCKQFLSFGSPLLYSKNVFSFYSSESYINLKRSWIEGDIHNPKYELPELNQLHEWPQAIPYVMDQIRRGVPLKQLPGWVYHDCFLRFLYIIRPHDAALIKTLMFNLIVSEHWCHANSGGVCPECRSQECVFISTLSMNFSQE